MTIETTLTVSHDRPPLTLSAEDYERLSTLANAARNAMPELAAELSDEVSRAQVLEKGEQARDVVRMNATVKFRDDTTNVVREVTLVYPHDADIAKGRISVMTPIGTALIGVPVGRSMTWETRSGETRRLTVIEVRDGQES